ncbi:MAG: DNA-3-methyladenine glycosylase family protein [Ferruginibacter sp.]
MSYKQHLKKDKTFAVLLQSGAEYEIQKRKHVYLHLCLSIMSQQLSTKVAQVFQDRFLALYGKKVPTLQQIANTPFETLRSIGLSNAKAQYVLNVVNFFIDHKITDAQLYKMSDEAVINLLTQIKGVGRWTVEMLLMFALSHEDVFAVDDLGLKQAVVKLYVLEHLEPKALKMKLIEISNRWSPYRTYACLYLWAWKDNTPATTK